MRINGYWRQAAAGSLTIMTPTVTGGGLDSLATTNSQPLKAQGQALPSPDKITIRDEGDNTQLFQAVITSQPATQTRAQVTAFGEVTTPKIDTTSLSRTGRLIVIANHDTVAQLLLVIIEAGEGGLIAMDRGWTNNAGYLLGQIKQKSGHARTWLLAHSDSDHMGVLADILYGYSGEVTVDDIYCSFAEGSWYTEKDPGVAKMVTYIKGAFGLVPQSMLHRDIVSGRVIQAGPAKTQVLNQTYKMNNDFINSNGVAYIVSLSGANIVFLGDLVKSDGKQLMVDHDLSALKCDIVQMVHHGQNGVDYEVYEVPGPSVAL